MRKRKDKAPEERQPPPNPLYEKHVAYVRLRNKGASNNQASALVGFRAETGSRIWLKYQSGGWEALKPRKRGAPLGHYRALTPEQEREIKLLVRGSTPQSLNLPYSVWNRESVKRLILEKYAIDLAMRTMSLYFSRWGFAYQRKIELIDIFWPE